MPSILTWNIDESQSAHSPTNPPKSQHTSYNNDQKQPQQQPTTNTPDDGGNPNGDDAIFSELSNQLHKEGAKQKLQDNNKDSDRRERPNGNRDDSDWHQGRHSAEDDKDDETMPHLPPDRPDDDYDDDREDDGWRPRQKGRPYGGYDGRPRRPLRPDDRYDDDNDDYADRKRPLDDDEEDKEYGRDDIRTGSNEEEDRYNSRYKEEDTGPRYKSQKTRVDNGKFEYDKEETKSEDDVSDELPIHKEDKSDESPGRSYQDHRNNEDNEQDVSKDDRDDKEKTSSDQREDEHSPKSSSKGESTKPDWYGQRQKSPNDPDSMEKVHHGDGDGRGNPGNDNDINYDRTTYQDYVDNYYNDKTPNWGNPNRYPPPNNYRNPYRQGGDYQEYVDYGRQGPNGRLPPGQGRGRGRGRGQGGYRNWPPGGNSPEQDVREDEPLDKQGEDRDQDNTADMPHSRRLRPGKILFSCCFLL